MLIALCDDDSAALDYLEHSIDTYSKEHNLEAVVERFSCGEELLAADKAGVVYDIIFMDIYLSEKNDALNGIKTVRMLGSLRKHQIIFTTTSSEHAIEAFELNAAHYLLKPLTDEKIAEAMTRCLERLGKGISDTLNVKTKQGVVFIPTENIIYIEVFNKVSHIRTFKNTIQTYASLDSLYELLDESVFMRAQRSFIVNMTHIAEFSFDHLIMKGGKEIMLSRNNRSELKKIYQNFLFNLARSGEI